MPSLKHMDLVGKVAIITGASSGIGRGVAISFASQGCQLAISGRDQENLDLTKSQCIEQGLSPDHIITVKADVMNNDDIDQIMSRTIEAFGKLDILINNAGIVDSGAIESFPMERYHRLMQVNVHSLVYLTKLAVPYLEKTKGSIINVSSVNGLRPFPGVWAYNMTKAAVDQFCRSLALDLGPKGIRVNNVNPGLIITNIHRRGGQSEEEYAAFLVRGLSTHAMQRAGDVSEVASVISFLVSEKAAYTTGGSFLMDGGRHAMTFIQPPETS